MTHVLLSELTDRQKWVCRAGATASPLLEQLTSATQKTPVLPGGSDGSGWPCLSANQVWSRKAETRKRGKWELCLKLSGSYPWHERAGKGWGFPLSALVTNKEKKPKPVLKQLDSITVAHLVLDLFVASFCFPCKVCAWNFCFIYLFEVFSLWESLHTPHRPNISSFFVRAEHLTEKHSVWRKESCICQFIQLTHSILSVSNPPALRLVLSVHQQNMILNPA